MIFNIDLNRLFMQLLPSFFVSRSYSAFFVPQSRGLVKPTTSLQRQEMNITTSCITMGRSVIYGLC